MLGAGRKGRVGGMRWWKWCGVQTRGGDGGGKGGDGCEGGRRREGGREERRGGRARAWTEELAQGTGHRVGLSGWGGLR